MLTEGSGNRPSGLRGGRRLGEPGVMRHWVCGALSGDWCSGPRPAHIPVPGQAPSGPPRWVRGSRELQDTLGPTPCCPGHQPPVGMPGSLGCHHLPAFSLCVGQATVATWRCRNLGLWPLGKMAQPARILVSFLLSKLKPCARWQMSVACVTVQEGQRGHWPKHPPPSALMPRQRGTSWVGFVASPVADAGAAASQCRQVLRGRPAWVTDPRLHCPGESAFCTFSISDLRQHSCTNVAFLGAVQGAGCRLQAAGWPSDIV